MSDTDGATRTGLGPWRPSLGPHAHPLYLAIADAMAADLREGRLSPGERLPPQRELARALEVDLTTVTRAYAEARGRGLIEARIGQGTFVRSRTELPGRVLDVSMNLPPVFDDPALARRMWEGVGAAERIGGLPLLLGYQEAGGGGEDRVAGTRYLAERLPGLSIERLLVCAGAQAGLMAVFSLLCRPGDTVCAEALCYPGFRALADHLGLKVVPLAMDGDGLLPEALEAACAEHAPRALYCTPTLNNPTTATLPMARREAIAAIARRRGLVIVEDDAYGVLAEHAPPPLAALAPERTYHVAGLAKSLSPALRIAYLAAPSAAETARLAAALRACSGMASPLTALIATHWVQTGVAAEVREAIRRETRARHASLRRRLPSAAVAASPEAFHVWLSLPPSWSRGTFAAEARARGVAAAPSDLFCLAPDPPNAVRLGLGAFPTREALDQGLETVRDLLRQPGPAAP